MTNKILTPRELPQLPWAVEKAAWTMAHWGELLAPKVCAQWWFRRADLDAWIGAQARRAAGEEESK